MLRFDSVFFFSHQHGVRTSVGTFVSSPLYKKDIHLGGILHHYGVLEKDDDESGREDHSDILFCLDR